MHMITISQHEAPPIKGFPEFTDEHLDADSIENHVLGIAASSEERLRMRSSYELQEWLAEIRELAQSHMG